MRAGAARPAARAAAPPAVETLLQSLREDGNAIGQFLRQNPGLPRFEDHQEMSILCSQYAANFMLYRRSRDETNSERNGADNEMPPAKRKSSSARAEGVSDKKAKTSEDGGDQDKADGHPKRTEIKKVLDGTFSDSGDAPASPPGSEGSQSAGKKAAPARGLAEGPEGPEFSLGFSGILVFCQWYTGVNSIPVNLYTGNPNFARSVLGCIEAEFCN